MKELHGVRTTLSRTISIIAVALLLPGDISAAPPEPLGPGPVTALAEGVSGMPPVTGSRDAPVASWGKPLPFPVVIADRRNNRLIEVTPDKRIVWAFDSPNLKVYRGNEDVIFDPATKKIAWEYYVPEGDGMLDHPLLVRELPTGDVIVSDDLRHRVIVIDRATKAIVWQYGVTDRAGNAAGELHYPTGTGPHLRATRFAP